MNSSFLNGYISDSFQLVEGDSKTYKIVTYQQEHKEEYTIYEMQDDKENGVAQHFDCGVSRYSWEMEDGKRCGYVTTYEKGKAHHKFLLKELENGEYRVLENCKMGLRMTIRNETGAVRFYGMCDESMRKNGYGVEYDVVTGKPLFCGVFRDDVQTHVFQEFHDDGTMTEYENGEASNLPLLKRIPIYIGGYSFSESDLYVRDGKGSLIDPLTGFASKECTWRNGVMVDSVSLRNGWYCYPDETVSLRGSVFRKKPISTPLHVSAMTKNVTTLVIPDDYDNASIQCLHFSDYTNLTSLTIGDDCLPHVTQVQIVAMETLRSVKIGRRSFSSKKALTRPRDIDAVKEAELWIEDCPCLKKLRIGALSFMEYESVRIENLLSLSEIRIGESETSNCFFSCRQLLIQCSVGGR